MKTEKLQLLESVIGAFGLTPEDVVEYFSKEVKKPAADNSTTENPVIDNAIATPIIIPAKKFVTPTHVEAGMFHYAEENLIFPEIIPELMVDSVIGFWDKNSGMGLCLDQEKLQWSSDFLRVDNEEVKSGFEATQMILNAAKREGKKAEAAQYCAKYAKYGITVGQTFMFSKFEAVKIWPNTLKIDKAFELLKVAKLSEYLWSSSEYSFSSAWILRPCVGASTGGLDDFNYKNDTAYVRPALALSI